MEVTKMLNLAPFAEAEAEEGYIRQAARYSTPAQNGKYNNEDIAADALAVSAAPAIPPVVRPAFHPVVHPVAPAASVSASAEDLSPSSDVADGGNIANTLPGTPAAPVALVTLADGVNQQSQGPRAAASSSRRKLPNGRPSPRPQCFRPINGGHRDPVPVAAAQQPQPQDPQQQQRNQPEKVRCVCSFCTSDGGPGNMVSKKTKHEHEHADVIDANGEEAFGDDICRGCRRKGNVRCVVWRENSKVCGHCVRIKEKCSLNGESERKREVLKRQKQAARERARSSSPGLVIRSRDGLRGGEFGQ
ncbi:hypothetical protein LX32DRAFT_323417 [Colletotrichum zoysiae]|uniref:Uncharacterized protein n=1 Tax=Colletotrichum zoysiae TaxID=1216348 RepID=A0AAD9HK54_9PEZI|nr:hypothetical protein LX32DRAFT_323417 [Colletotrichum zoysiae]